ALPISRHISPLPPGERGRGRGPEVADQHGTSDGPDSSRPLPNPLPRRERELFGVVCCFRGGRRIVPSYRTARQCNQCIQAGCSRRDTSPLSLLGRGAGGEGPKSQTSTEPLTGLITCALSLTLSPGGRGNLWDSARSLSRLLFLWAFILHGLLLELRQGIPFQVNELVHQAGGYLEVGGQLRAFYHVVVPIFRFAKLVADRLAVALQVQGQHRLFQAILGLRLGS